MNAIGQGDVWPRRCEIHSNQYFAEALCHGVGIGKEGRPYALIQYEDGALRALWLDDCYSVKLK